MQKFELTGVRLQVSGFSWSLIPVPCFSHRELEGEAGSALGPVSGGNAPACAFDNGAHDGQAQSAAGLRPAASRGFPGPRGVPRGKDLFESLLGDARPLSSTVSARQGAAPFAVSISLRPM